MVRKFNRNIGMSWANSCDGDHLADSGDGVYRGADGGGYVGRVRQGREPGIVSRPLFRLLPPCRRQRLCFARLACLIQGLDSPAVSLLISMVVTLGHRHRLVAGKLIERIPSPSKALHL